MGAGPFGTRLKPHGITPHSAGNTALVSLAGDVPAPVPADLLGLHFPTGVCWIKYAKRDWHSHPADRSGGGTPVGA